MISNKLLSEVMGYKCHIMDTKHIHFLHNNRVNDIVYEQGGDLQYNINKYELAHLCKQWALKQGYYFSTYSFNFDSNTEQEHRIRLLIGNDVVYFGDDSSMETEVEAIFKACQWILDKD